ncbi:DUF2812 domain-containing protein [Halalkalibacter flavus]|uniref:DUF2812 domain-containing protein n=1 Tax=Halalkalibacter flavus TaxID=3090668 RepID=UPI002FCB928B
MFKKNTAKKKHKFKKFTNFADEERWLQNMLQDGWILEKYGYEDEDGCTYVFKPIENKEQQNIIYKIDYREFDKKEDFLEYKAIFEDDGWTVLSKNKWYSKHIFCAESRSSNLDIFSDTESYKGREKRKIHNSLISAITGFVGFTILTILYGIFEKPVFGGVGLLFLISSLKFMVDYFRHRKALRSLV